MWVGALALAKLTFVVDVAVADVPFFADAVDVLFVTMNSTLEVVGVADATVGVGGALLDGVGGRLLLLKYVLFSRFEFGAKTSSGVD